MSFHLFISTHTTMSQSTFILLILFTITLITSYITNASSNTFSKPFSKNKLLVTRESHSHLHFYFHDTVSGKNPTAVLVARPLSGNYTLGEFGGINMIDDPLTIGPELSSELVGKAQGMYASASRNEIGLMMVMNLVFFKGKYGGSSLSLMGRNVVMSDVREMPIVGGTGVFRFARGFAEARTHKIDLKSGDAVVEYDVYVLHY